MLSPDIAAIDSPSRQADKIADFLPISADISAGH